MVVNDAPALGKLAKDEGKEAAGMAAVRHLQPPPPAYPSGLGRELLNIKIGKCQLAHRSSFALVALAITLQSLRPAFGDGAAGIEGQLRRVPVTEHVAFQVATVPRLYLRSEHGADAICLQG